MKIWVHINGVQEGPYEMSQLPLDRMTAETPVWYDGLENWLAAGRAPLTAHLFSQQGAEIGSQTEVHSRTQSHAVAQDRQEKPESYIIWSVILTVLCCNPLGIVSIIYGSMVNSRYNNYDIEGARRASETTAWWLMITIVTSLIFGPMLSIASMI